MAGPISQRMLKKLTNPWKFRLGMWMRLPSVAFWRVRLDSLTENECTVSIPYSWFTKNPFKSLYFAAMAGAGELSTGLLGILHTADRGNWSTLVIGFRAEYYKKATGRIRFSCDQGQKLVDLLDRIEKSSDPATIEMVSVATNKEGIEVAKIFVTWSYKYKGE